MTHPSSIIRASRTPLLFAMGALLLPGAVLAAPPAAPAPAPAPSATAVELARLMMPKEGYGELVKQLSGTVEASLQHPGAKKLNFPADLPQRIRTEVEAALPYEDLVGSQARHLAGAFSEPELKELVAFYRTPVGQKSMRAMGAVGNGVARDTDLRLGERMPQIVQKMAGLVKVEKAPDKHPAPAKPAAKK